MAIKSEDILIIGCIDAIDHSEMYKVLTCTRQKRENADWLHEYVFNFDKYLP